MRPASARFLGLLILVLTGCKDSQDLPWELTFTDAALRSELAVLEASIFQGSCGGREIWRSVFVPGDGQTELPPQLSEGRYCFAASARNAGCEVYARGEQELELPSDGQVVIRLLAAVPRLQRCDANQPCARNGRCGPPGCAAGLGDCDGNVPNGCETVTNTDLHCGGCGIVCSVAQSCCRGAGCCLSGSCGLTCNPTEDGGT